MLKLRAAAMVKRGKQGRARLSPLTTRVQQAGLAAVAIASLGLVLSRCDEGITDSAAGIRFDKLGLVGGRADPNTTA